jgi:hypothetical protein
MKLILSRFPRVQLSEQTAADGGNALEEGGQRWHRLYCVTDSTERPMCLS